MLHRPVGSDRTREAGAGKRLVSIMCSAAIACGALVVPSVSQAAAGDDSASSSRFLGGSLLLDNIDLDSIVQLDGTESSNSGVAAPDTDTASLDLTALSLLNLEIPGGVSLGVLPDILQVGAVNHYSQASDDGVSRAASGAVSNAGAVDTTGSGSFPADARISLTPLLSGAGLTAAISTLDIAASAVTGVAALDAARGPLSTSCTDLSAPDNCRDYNVADLTLDVDAPAVAAIVDLLTGPGGVAETVDAAVDGLAGPNGLLADALATVTGVAELVGDGGTEITITSDITGALDTVIDAGLTDGIVDIDLRNGNIDVDLDALLFNVTGTGVNDLAPNTEIITPALLTALAGRIDALLLTLPGTVEAALDTALNAATLHVDVRVCPIGCVLPLVDIEVDGTIAEVLDGTATASVSVLLITVNVSALLGALAAPLAAALFDANTGVIATSVDALELDIITQSGLVTAAFELLNTIVSLVANVQEAGVATGSYREVGLRLTIGDLIGAGGVGTLDLGRAEVGPNTLLPTAASLSPVSGPVVGGTEVTITGTNFVDGATTVVVDGVDVTPTAVTSTAVTFVSPAHAAGAVDVVVETSGGETSPALEYTYLPGPTAASLAPEFGPLAGGTEVTITGTNFVDGATTVVVDGVDVTPTAVTSTAVTFVSPAHAAGAVDVVVETSGGETSPALKYTYLPGPTAVSLAPEFGPLAGGTEVTITGTNFVDGATTVVVDGVDVTPTAVSATSVTFVSPAHAAGAVDVVVETPGGATSPALEFTYVPVPTGLALTPEFGPIAGGTEVTVTGSGFVAGETSVSIGGNTVVAADVTVASATSMSFDTPAHAAGETDVFVTTPGGTTSPALGFTYVPAPTGVSLAPEFGPIAGGTEVTVTGSGFVAGETSVLIGGNTVVATDVTVSSPTELSFDSPAHAAGAVDVFVTTPGGVTSPALEFTYVPTPTESSLAPERGPTVGGTVVTIIGTGFVAGETSVTIDALSVSATVASATSLTFVTPPHVAATVPVSVTTPGGSTPADLTFTYDPAPTALSMTPVRGPVAGGTAVTVTGTGFLAATTVHVDGVAVPASVAGPTTLSFVTPPHAAGDVDVTVTTTGGTSAPLEYSYDPVPGLESLSPNHGSVAGGTIVTVNGSGFVAGSTTVTVDTDIVPATVTSPTVLTFVTPPHSLGDVDVQVNTPGGTSAPLTYTYDLTPGMSSLDPGRGPVEGGTIVTVVGSGFETSATEVTIGGTTIPATEVTVESSTSLTFVTPADDAGPVEVTVTTAGGASEIPLTYVYDPAPTVSTLSPDLGPAAGGTTVTVTGFGFVADHTSVLIGGNTVAAAAVSVDSSTSLTFVTPAHPIGDVEVTVQTPGGTSDPLGFTYGSVPTITELSPARGPVGGGMTITATGTDFVPGSTTIEMNGTSIPATVISPTTLQFVNPADEPGMVPVVASTPGGASAPLGWTYDAVPEIDTLTPARDVIAGGATVVVSGDGFIDGLTTITVDGVTVTVDVRSSSVAAFVAPPHTAAVVDVVVATTGGAADPEPFTYMPVPEMDGLDVTSGPSTGGTTVTIDGSGFMVDESSVEVGGIMISPADVDVADTGTSLTFVTPPSSPGMADVVVSTPGGVASPPLEFGFVAPAPVVPPTGLPATGSDSNTLLAVGVGALLLGALMIAAAGRRRRDLELGRIH